MAEGAPEGTAPAGRGHSLGTLNAVFVLTEALHLPRRTGAAAALSDWLEESRASGTGCIAFDWRLMKTRAGIAATGARRWQDAEAHHRRALELAAELPNNIEQADVPRLYARMQLGEKAAATANERGHS